MIAALGIFFALVAGLCLGYIKGYEHGMEDREAQPVTDI